MASQRPPASPPRTASTPNEDSTDLIPNSDSNNQEIKETLDLIKEGESKIELKEEYKNFTLVLGPTGSGKSTFVQWIAGDDDKLISEKVGSGEFIIEDGNRISNSNTTTTSQTTFPELCVDKKTNAAYYDCPGFRDTRSTSHDISSAYFIKKLTDHAENLKFIFVISYPFVRKGGERDGFLKLLRQSNELIKNIAKYQNSIFLVVTKVENLPENVDGKYVLIPDDKVIKNISAFIGDCRNDLIGKLTNSKTSAEDKIFWNHALSMIDSFLTKEGENYERIGILRRPDVPGPLSEIKILKSSKDRIENILQNKLQFTRIAKGDFGYTVSEKSKNDITQLVEEIDKIIWSDIRNIVAKLKVYYGSLIDSIRKKINSFNSAAGANYVINQTDAEVFANTINMGSSIFTNLLKEVPNEPTNKVAEKMIVVNTLGIDTCRKEIKNILNQGKYYEFLQSFVKKRKFAPQPWENIVKEILDFLSSEKRSLQNYIQETALKINKSIMIIIDGIAEEIKQHYVNLMNTLEIRELLKALDGVHKVALNIKQITESMTTAEALSTVLEENISHLDIENPKIRRGIISLSHFTQYLQFLEVLSSQEITTWSSSSTEPLKNMEKYIDETERWYRFLNDLHGKLSSGSENKEAVDLSDVLSEYNIKGFLGKIKSLDLEEYAAVQNTQITDSKLEELNKLLDETIRSNMQQECESNNLIVKGNNIKFSDFLSGDGDLKPLCDGYDIRSIYIFGFNSLVVDVSFQAVGKKLQVAAIAPKWDIRGNKIINLSGSDGAPPEPPKANNGTNGGNGDDGVPGNSGGSSGSFLGIGEEFLNGSNLKIYADGGHGGPGQDGGNGANGADGETASQAMMIRGGFKDRLLCNYFSCSTIGFECLVVNATGLGVMGLYAFDFFIFGKEGQNGRDGGNGGMGGCGGNAGKIKLTSLKTDSKVSLSRISGSEGTAGVGGLKGIGGKKGDVFKITCVNAAVILSLWVNGTVFAVDTRAASGNDGRVGENRNCTIEQEESETIRDSVNIINDYKTFFRSNLFKTNNLFGKQSLLKFFNRFEDNSEIKSTYNTLAFVRELKTMEEQTYLASRHKLELLSFYKSFLDRVSEYAKQPKSDEESDQHKKILSYVYTAAVIKVSDLKSELSAPLILDVKQYLDIVQNNINDLKILKDNNNKLKIINQYKKNYRDDIDEKIEEAKTFINKYIIAELDKFNGQIEQKIELLINEVVQLQEKAKKEAIELHKKQRELELAMMLSIMFGSLKVTGQALSLLGPAGVVAGSVIGLSTSIVEAISLSGQSSDGPAPLLLPKAIQESKQLLENIKGQKVSKLQKQINAISVEIGPNNKELSDITTFIDEIQKELKSEVSPDQVAELDIKLTHALRKKEKVLLEKQKDEANKKYEKPIEILGKINKMADVGVDMYNKYKGDQKKIDAMSESINMSRKKFEDLKDYENKIHTSIAPTLKRTERDLKEVRISLKKKSQVALDVAKWQVQSSLKDMRMQMRKLTKGFQVEDDLSRCIEKLDEAMTTLINIYDRIQDYQEQQKLANYIADISSASANKINVSDPKLANAINELEATIRSNIVMIEYEAAINAFKQWVFPFAGVYLKQVTLPSQFKLNVTNIDDTVSQAIRQLHEVKSNLDKYKITTDKTDEYINHALFNNENISATPFFVWKNVEYKDDLSKLLSGEAVMVKADVTRSPRDKDAVKFNMIKINFKSANKTKQAEINEMLKGFQVSTIHMGNSYYRWGGKYYVMTSKSQDIQYSFEMDKNGVPVSRNKVYEKMEGGDLVLSPYAMWKIQLFKAPNTASFDALKTYEEDVDLEFVGKGSFVSRKVNSSNLRVDDFYKPDSSIEDIYGQFGEDLFQNREEKVSFASNTALGVRLSRRSVYNPDPAEESANNNAGKLTSWYGSVLKTAKKFKELVLPTSSDASKNNINPAFIREDTFKYIDESLGNDQHSSSFNENAIPDLGHNPNILEMGDQWITNTNMTGLFALGTLLLRKWSGYRPKLVKRLTQDQSQDILWAILSREIVDAFINWVEKQAVDGDIKTSEITDFPQCYIDSIKTVTKMLAQSDVENLGNSLFEVLSQATLVKRPKQVVWLAKLKASVPEFQQNIMGHSDIDMFPKDFNGEMRMGNCDTIFQLTGHTLDGINCNFAQQELNSAI